MIPPNPDPLQLALQLLARPSITPEDAGCHQILADLLRQSGFHVEQTNHPDPDNPRYTVANLYATHTPDPQKPRPIVCLAGHSDVVPPGPPEAWSTPPFQPEIRDHRLYARGASDMKGALAALTVAAVRFAHTHPRHRGTLALLVTSDEEGQAQQGTAAVLEQLAAKNRLPDFALVGEPTSEITLGDTIKVGRRGSLSARLTVHGVQGHVAYPHLADNPVHRLAPFLAELLLTKWDDGHPPFPPTSLQISNIHAGTGAVNVIPGQATLDFNFRTSPATTAQDLTRQVEALADKHHLKTNFQWAETAQPFLTQNSRLLQAIVQAIAHHTNQTPAQATGGGTSDARFFALHQVPVVEFGPENATIHAIDENIPADQIPACADIYGSFLQNLLLP